jgi:hypothetical protein
MLRLDKVIKPWKESAAPCATARRAFSYST